MKIGIFIANYAIDNSPSILNLIHFLIKSAKVDLFLFNISYTSSINKRVSNLSVFKNNDLNEIKNNVSQKDYNNIIAIDPHGFFYCKKVFPGCKPIYYSLELYLKEDHSGLDYPKDLMDFERKHINEISALLIQCTEKARLFREDYALDSNIPEYYLPVTYNGYSEIKKSEFLRKSFNLSSNTRIAVHLGGIAEYFSCKEIINEFGKLSDWVLIFQGYPNPKYLLELKEHIAANKINNIIFSDVLFSSFEDTYPILASSDVGIAWYNNISTGFRLAGYSSGKISAYLKFGLPIIAKSYQSTKDTIQSKGAGICVDEVIQIPEALNRIVVSYAQYSFNAVNEYNKTYRFEAYEEMLKALLLTPSKNKVNTDNLAPQEYWDKSYEKYNFTNTPKEDPIRKWIEKYVPKGTGICLELGAFPGRYLSLFGELGYELSGIDLTPQITSSLPDWLRQNGFRTAEFIKADFNEHNFERKYEVVCSFGFIEHFKGWEKILEKKMKLVEDGGLIIVEAPNFNGPLQKFLHATLDEKNLQRHNTASMDPELWKQLLIKNNFEIIFSGYFGGFDFWVDSQERTESQKNVIQAIDYLKPYLKDIHEDDRAYSPYCGVIARKNSETKPVSLNENCEEFEVNNWKISEFVINNLIPIVSFMPFPLNELLLMVGTVIRLRPTHIFDWGTNIGVSARVFYETIKYFNINCEIHTIDLPNEIDHVEHPRNNRGLLIKGLESIYMHLGDGVGKSMEIIKTLRGEKRLLFFIDGDHSYNSVSRELSIIDKNIKKPNMLLHDTFYQSSGSNYNTGPFKAIQDFLLNSRDNYKMINVNTGLLGMTLLFQVENKKNNVDGIKSNAIKNEARDKRKLQSGMSVKYTSNRKALNILHTVEFYDPHIGGAEFVVQQISERLVRRGHLVTVATSKASERNFKELNGVNIVEFDIIGSLGNGITGSGIKKYQEFLSMHSADIMMNYAAQQWSTDVAFSVFNKILQTRVNIIAPCGYSALQDSKTIRWNQFAQYYNEFIPKVIPLYDAAVYHSSKYQDFEFAINHGFRNSVVIPNGVGEDEFENSHEINFREKYGIKNKFMGLCVANYFKSKGHIRIIEALKKANRNDITVVFIGKDGEELNNLKKNAEGLNIIFLKDIEREETVSAFEQADLFLFGSYIEAFPLVILEAMASKTPFVSTDCGNVRELKGGIVCEENEITFNINKLLDNESLRKQLAYEGYTEWKEKYTWESITDKYEELYLGLYHGKFVKGTRAKVNEIQSGIEKNFKDIDLYLQAAKLLIKQNANGEAKKYLEDVLELDVENNEAHSLLNLIAAEE